MTGTPIALSVILAPARKQVNAKGDEALAIHLLRLLPK